MIAHTQSEVGAEAQSSFEGVNNGFQIKLGSLAYGGLYYTNGPEERHFFSPLFWGDVFFFTF